MDIRKLQRAIVDGLEDVKAQDIAVFNTESLSPLFERVVIATGSSNRQTKALASSVRETVKGRGMEVLSTEGEDNGEWIIVDCGQAVVHVMQPAIREYYHLEEIWGGKSVRVKLGAAKTGLPKASEPIDDDEAPKPARKTARKTGVASAEEAKRASLPKRAAAADATPAARKVAKKAAAPKPAAKAPARKTAAAKTPARKTASRRADPDAGLPVQTVKVQPARKVAAKKPAAKRPAAKAPARKTAARKTAG